MAPNNSVSEAVAAPPTMEANYDWLAMEDAERVKRVDMAGWVEATTEPRFSYITNLLQELFQVPISTVSLITPDRICLKAPVGFGDTEQVPRCFAMCNFVCVSPKPEAVVFENTRLDARLAHNPFVKGDPGLLFYAAAPLVGTGGTRYGTMCVCDYKPRSFTAEMYRLLINFAELAVQELESDQKMLERWTKDAIASARLNNEMQACVSTAIEGVAMIDARRPAWEMVYTNTRFSATCGEPVEDLVGKGFWHLFKPIDGTKFDDITATTAVGGSRVVGIESCKTGAQFTIALYPASTDRLAPGKATGIPSWLPSENDPTGKLGVISGEGMQTDVSARDKSACIDVEKCFYFAVVQPVGRKRLRSDSDAGQSDSSIFFGLGSAHNSVSSKESASSYGDFTPPQSLDGLQLGPLVGSGSFGKVYRASWNDAMVAAKVVRCLSEELFQWSVDEGRLAMSVVHPNVVKTVQMGVDLAECYFKDGVELDAVHVLWILQEYCDRGTLVDAVERGCMRTHRHIHAPPDMMAVYRTLKDIADGMAAIHAKGIVHCDLNGRNVMLTASDSDPRGYVAKVADFGLARMCHGEEMAPCKTFGTISHLPPELLNDQIMSAAGDVWAFGVTMWEVVSGYRAHLEKSKEGITVAVMSGKGAMTPPSNAPQTYKDILAACMQNDPRTRPTFEELGGLFERAILEEEGSMQ